VKTTVELPDDLITAIKIRAVSEGRRLKDLIPELLRRGLESADGTHEADRRVRFPLIRTAHTASPDEELTPERVAGILLDQDVEALTR
jgi:plasmid stability protein